MNFNYRNPKIIGGIAAVAVSCLFFTSISWDFLNGSAPESENINSEYLMIPTSAGAIASIGEAEDSTAAGASEAVSAGTVDIVNMDNNTVGQPSDSADETTGTEETPNTEYKTFGYTNLGLADVEGNLNVRKGASTGSAVVGKLTKYAACEILEEVDGWYKITSGNVEGYVSAEYIITGEEALILAQTEARTVATVTTSSLRVRKEPSTDAKKLSNVAKGEELYVEEILEGWAKVEFDGYDEAYVSLDYVTIEEKLKTGNTMAELRYGGEVSDVRIDLVNYALQFVGNKYVWGGTSLTKGVDCSGFTMQVYKKFGISLPHYSKSQPKYGTKIKASQAQPGDLFFYGDSDGINHVAIYIGNGKIVHAANKRDGIKISNAFYRTPICVVRYFND